MAARNNTGEITRPAYRVARILDDVLAGLTPKVRDLQGILDVHGWPDIAEVRRQADALRALGHKPVTFEPYERPRAGAS